MPESLRRVSLHDHVTRTLALRVIAGERIFPKEADLCSQLGVSRSILREAVKVLTDKGMLEVRPRAGTRARPRADWNLLDPDILCWQAQGRPGSAFLRDLCEVRLAIEPTAAGFAALRATPSELAAIEECILRRKDRSEDAVDLDLRFYTAVVAASQNPLFQQLSASIREPLRASLACTVRLEAYDALAREAHRGLFEAIRKRDPLKARVVAEEIVGLAMLAVEQVIREGAA
jgi:GntR family galactonate operon transcriptional repressor